MPCLQQPYRLSCCLLRYRAMMRTVDWHGRPGLYQTLQSVIALTRTHGLERTLSRLLLQHRVKI